MDKHIADWLPPEMLPDRAVETKTKNIGQINAGYFFAYEHESIDRDIDADQPESNIVVGVFERFPYKRHS